MVTQWNATNIISRHDVFKMLKLIYASRLSVYQQNNAKVYSGVFQETILQLEKVEEALEQIANREAPTREEFNQSVKENDQEQIARIISFYQNLRVDQRLHELLRNHRYSFNVISFYKLLFMKERPFIATERDVTWGRKNFPEQEVFDFAEMLQERLKKQQVIIRQEENRLLKKYAGAVEDLNRLMRVNKQLYATCFDIEITSRKANWKDEIQSYLRTITNAPDFGTSLLLALDLRAYYLTLEVNENEAFKIFLVVLQNKAEKSHTNALSLERMLMDYFHSVNSKQFPFDINVLDIGKSIQKKCHPKAVGYIGSLTSLRQFQYWILGYLYFRWRYLQPHFNSYDETQVERYFEGKILVEIAKEKPLAEVETLPPEVKRMPEKRELPTRFEQIDLSKQQVRIWSDSGLPAKAKTYLKLIELLYSEQRGLGVMQYSTAFLNDILRIEKFMQTLLYYPALAFDYPNDKFERVQQNPGRYLTQVAKQYLEIAWALQKPDPLLLFTAQSIGSAFVNSLLRSYSDSRYGANHLLQWLISPRGFHAFTSLLMHFKSEGKYLYSSTIETSKRNTVAKNKAETYKYLRVIMKQDVLAIRFILSCNFPDDKDHDQNAFRAWITDFIKNIKRRPRAIGAELLGYIGTYIYNQGLAVDMVLLFNTDAVGEVDQSIANAIQQYWQNYVIEKQKNIEKQKLKTKKEVPPATSITSFPYMSYFEGAELVAEQRPVMASIRQLNAMGLILISSNRSLKNLFIKSLADYFSGYCLICPQGPGESSGSSGFFKGSLSRNKKTETSKKQTKVTKSVQAGDSKQKALAGQKPHQYSYAIAQQRIPVYARQSFDGGYAINSESILKLNPKPSAAVFYSSALSNAE